MTIWDSLPIWIQNSVEWFNDRPFLLLLTMAVPLVLIGFSRRSFPSWLMLLFAVTGVPISFLVIYSEEVLDFLIVFDVVLVVVAIIDALTTVTNRGLVGERQTLRVVSVGKPHKVTLVISNRKRRKLHVVIKDDIPQKFTVNRTSFTLSLRPRSRATVSYQLRSQSRGKFHMSWVHVRVSSRFRLWRTYLRLPVESEFHVYPDLKQLGQYAVMARTNRLSLIGVKRTRKIGQDNEFERLRDYTQDDNYKHIDWRSTARRNKLTVRDFQVNQSQRIIFMVDCGRMMMNRSEGMSLLDHSLNAMLMMSYVALRQGDSVGLICFSNSIHRYVPPRGSMGQMNHLLHAVFDRFPDLVESRYDQAFLHLANHCPKRAMVVLITNLVDEVNSLQVEQYLGSVVGRHLPMGVLLRDRVLFDAADEPSKSVEAVYQSAAAAEILTWRHQVLVDLEHRGVLSLDVFPEDMTAPLINRYLDIKARHLL